MDLFNLFDNHLFRGTLYIAGSILSFLFATGHVQIARHDLEKSRQWREKHGTSMKWCGAVLLVIGILKLFNVY